MLKRFLSVLFATVFLIQVCFADCCETICVTEHLDIHKDAPCNLVTITPDRKIIQKGNVLLFVFDEQFFSKCSRAGDTIHFDVPDAIYTQEGTLLFPCGTKITAEVIKIEHPRWFNKNARVSIIFRHVIFPNNTCIAINARPFTCDYKLKEGAWTTTGKLVASTLTLGVVGAGAGVGFSFIPNPAKIGTGLAIGIPVGCGVGFALGLITPGCHYKAKKGEKIFAILIDDLCLNKDNCD